MPESLFENAPDILPVTVKKGMSIPELIALMGRTSFEARNVFRGSELYKRMIFEGDTIWLGIAGAGIAGGMGGIVISLMQAGFIDVICSTGAQVYHDLHFAFDLPVKAIPANQDDNLLREHGDTRIYDIGIRERETLGAQDELIRQFIRERYDKLSEHTLSSWEVNYHLGLWAGEKASHPERSFVVMAAQLGIPLFWDSQSNHSIAMNLLNTDREGFPVILSSQKDIFDSTAIAFTSDSTGFVNLGGGGPKNFIQQTGPTISQIFAIDFEGAERGLQISTAVEREGSLSSCTFGEAVTWGKYHSADEDKMVQIWGEYSVVFPLIASYVIDSCPPRSTRNLISQIQALRDDLEAAR
jgi:deoxyhypusine synthase